MIITIYTTSAIILFAYFFGSIPGAIIICKILHYPDPRKYGSKNPGATNIYRILGYKLAILVMLFDSLKGAIPIWIGSYIEISPVCLQITAISSCIGHIYPVFFKFHGGKGIATIFGSLSAISSDFSIVMIGTWIVVTFLFKYVSLGSIITAIVMPIYVWYTQPKYLYCILLMTFIILISHSNNIKRLWKQQERSIWNR